MTDGFAHARESAPREWDRQAAYDAEVEKVTEEIVGDIDYYDHLIESLSGHAGMQRLLWKIANIIPLTEAHFDQVKNAINLAALELAPRVIEQRRRRDEEAAGETKLERMQEGLHD